MPCVMACPPELTVRGREGDRVSICRQGGAASARRPRCGHSARPFFTVPSWPVPQWAPGRGGQPPSSAPCLGRRRVTATLRRPSSPFPLHRHTRDWSGTTGRPSRVQRGLQQLGRWASRRPAVGSGDCGVAPPVPGVPQVLWKRADRTPALAGTVPHGARRDQGLYLLYLLDRIFLLEGHHSVSFVQTRTGTHRHAQARRHTHHPCMFHPLSPPPFLTCHASLLGMESGRTIPQANQAPVCPPGSRRKKGPRSPASASGTQTEFRLTQCDLKGQAGSLGGDSELFSGKICVPGVAEEAWKGTTQEQ